MTYEARVVSGRGRGRRIGFPTVNLKIPNPFPYAHGIYAGLVWVDGRQFLTAFHFGPIPTFHEEAPSLEAYLIDAEISEVPETVVFELVKFLREIKTFLTAEELAVQIRQDVEDVRQTLNQT